MKSTMWPRRQVALIVLTTAAVRHVQLPLPSPGRALPLHSPTAVVLYHQPTPWQPWGMLPLASGFVQFMLCITGSIPTAAAEPEE